MNTPLFLFGMKLFQQKDHIKFFDADFCNTITVESRDFTDKSLGDCCKTINEHLKKAGFEDSGLRVG